MTCQRTILIGFKAAVKKRNITSKVQEAIYFYNKIHATSLMSLQLNKKLLSPFVDTQFLSIRWNRMMIIIFFIFKQFMTKTKLALSIVRWKVMMSAKIKHLLITPTFFIDINCIRSFDIQNIGLYLIHIELLMLYSKFLRIPNL